MSLLVGSKAHAHIHTFKKTNKCTAIFHSASQNCRTTSNIFMDKNRKQTCCFRILQISHFLECIQTKFYQILKWIKDSLDDQYLLGMTSLLNEHEHNFCLTISDWLLNRNCLVESFNFSIISFRCFWSTMFEADLKWIECDFFSAANVLS